LIARREQRPEPRTTELLTPEKPEEQESPESGTPVLRNSKFWLKRKFINDLITGSWVKQDSSEPEGRRIVVLRRDETIFEVSEVTGKS